MRLIGREKLLHLGENEEATKWLRHWIAEVRDANWKRAGDVCAQFPNAQLKGGNSIMFTNRKSNLAIE